MNQRALSRFPVVDLLTIGLSGLLVEWPSQVHFATHPAEIAERTAKEGVFIPLGDEFDDDARGELCQMLEGIERWNTESADQLEKWLRKHLWCGETLVPNRTYFDGRLADRPEAPHTPWCLPMVIAGTPSSFGFRDLAPYPRHAALIVFYGVGLG